MGAEATRPLMRFGCSCSTNPAETSPSPSSGSHSLVKKVNLTAWLLSGVPSTTETFRKELKTLSLFHGESPQSPSTQRISARRSSIVTDGAEIRFLKIRTSF
ncbi:hypothetical protein ElyMa_000925700 [Elysia marginata]|uniref:Uncharacterized protein n=1 Tax=Elysia marginata TaxID=1093978 RepID=A0AAV4HAX6_9GAST|nr:hypothetical protein ElyMa_000925700 [Elysia marginata]